MSRINEMMTLAYITALNAIDNAKNNVQSFNGDERGIEGFVVALILIAVAALLAIAFRESLQAAITTLIDSLKKLFEF